MAMQEHWLDEIYKPGDSVDSVLQKLGKRPELRSAITQGLADEIASTKHQEEHPDSVGYMQGQVLRSAIQEAIAPQEY